MNTPLLTDFTLPTTKLLLSAVLTSLAAAAGWTIVTLLGPWDSTTTLVGLLGIGIVAVVSVIGTLAMRPWHPRTVVAWGGVLVATSVSRAVVAIGGCLLLYSAARQPAEPLLLGAMAGLIPVLIGETKLAARRFRREDT
jgi:drug/metabolite transporter superfamily protein YnfA